MGGAILTRSSRERPGARARPNSLFVRALSFSIRCRKVFDASKPCVVAPFGSPSFEQAESAERKSNERPLRVLFAGALRNEKGWPIFSRR